jgi:hypothetical protein
MGEILKCRSTNGQGHITNCATLRACCRLAALLDVPLVQGAQNVVPVAVTAAESVERLRTWASGRCLDADRGGIYQGGGAKSTARRKVSRSTLNN